MAKDKEARRIAANAIGAWVSFLGPVLGLLADLDVPGAVVHRFLDLLEMCFFENMDGEEQALAMKLVRVARREVPVND